MSRARVHEVSSPISLFPFIGILLCTMGALLVVLVAVSRSARNTAVREEQTRHQSQPQNEAATKKLASVNAYVGSLEVVRGKAERRLHDEQARLSHLEDSIRRLHEKFESLQAAAAALQSMEREHYDDRKQAEREVKRLNELVDESQKSVESMREAASKAAHSYAVVPYEGPNGTFRRPIYIECVKEGLILQPEGVRLTVDDLRPPMGPGNPLATVLRAARDQIIRTDPHAGQSRDKQPYPLLLVRPEGLYAYDRARQAIEAGDFDLGFDLVESDWKLKYPAPDPQLAQVEQQSLVQARARQVLLAAAAPRAYSNGAIGAAGDYGDDDYGDDSSSDGLGDVSASGGAVGDRYGGGSRTYITRSGEHSGDDGGDGGLGGGGRGGTGGSDGSDGGSGAQGMGGRVGGVAGGSGGTGGSGGSPDDGHSAAWAPRGSAGESRFGSGTGMGAGDGGGSPGTSTGVSGSVSGSGPSGPSGGAGGVGVSGGEGSGMPGGSPPDKNLVPDGYESPAGGSVTVSTSPQAGIGQPGGPESHREQERIHRFESRGKDWALRGKPPRSVPVRRTIHVMVAKDQLAIMPDSMPAGDSSSAKVIRMRGDTVESIDEFVKQVRDHIDGWGMAGNGLYWRPVVLLRVEGDAQQRAEDLARLLKNSGLEIRTDQIASRSPKGNDHETR